KPSRLAVRRSPPEPLTHRTSTLSPVSGSCSISFDEVFPPPVLVSVRSSPSLLHRETRRSRPDNFAATSSCQRYLTNLNVCCLLIGSQFNYDDQVYARDRVISQGKRPLPSLSPPGCYRGWSASVLSYVPTSADRPQSWQSAAMTLLTPPRRRRRAGLPVKKDRVLSDAVRLQDLPQFRPDRVMPFHIFFLTTWPERHDKRLADHGLSHPG